MSSYVKIYIWFSKVEMNKQHKVYFSSPARRSIYLALSFYIIGENSFTLKMLKGGISVFKGTLEMHVCLYLHLKEKLHCKKPSYLGVSLGKDDFCKR